MLYIKSFIQKVNLYDFKCMLYLNEFFHDLPNKILAHSFQQTNFFTEMMFVLHSYL